MFIIYNDHTNTYTRARKICKRVQELGGAYCTTSNAPGETPRTRTLPARQ
jgi:hypothetical protein